MTSIIKALATTRDAVKLKIIRALCCASGEHEPWEAISRCGYYEVRTVHGEIETRDHGDLFVAVCRHCRTVYCRKRNE